jgi:hypothetical protein
VAKFILGQRKVQSSRPKSGAPMHLMIFYGFMALFLATTLLFIAVYGQAVGIPNFHKGAYYLAYEAVFDVLGMFFVVGVAWAWGRRINLLRQYGPAVINPETGKPEFNGNPLSHEVKDRRWLRAGGRTHGQYAAAVGFLCSGRLCPFQGHARD